MTAEVPYGKVETRRRSGDDRGGGGTVAILEGERSSTGTGDADSRLFEEAAERKLLRSAREKIVAACLAVQPGLNYREWFNVDLSEISATLSPAAAGRSKAWTLLWDARTDLEAMGRIARASGESDARVEPLRKSVMAKAESARQMLDSGR